MTFSILEHLDKLEPDGGSESPNEKSFLCPVCGSHNFKVELKDGKYSTYGCDCADNEDGKRKIRNVLSPAKNPNGDCESLKPIRTQQVRHWDYFTERTLIIHGDGGVALTVHRTDDGNGKRKIWQKSRINGHEPAEVGEKVLPYGIREARKALENGERWIFWVEGEPCVDALRSIGLTAITTLGGSENFRPDRDGGHIPADRICILPDQDDAGIKYAEKVAATYPEASWCFPFPGSAQWNGKRPKSKGLDVADWIAKGAIAEHILNGIGGKAQEPVEPKAEPAELCDEETTSAGELLDISERLAEGRKLFSIHGLLPQDLAAAVELLQRPLPTDDLSAVMAVITGYSGLMKLGTRVASSINFSVPANLFAAMVMHSGGAKTSIKKTLVDAPAHDIRRDAARAHRQSMEQWQAQDKKDRAPIAPRPVFPHLSDYTTAALSQQLQHNESLGFGQLVVADELSGLLQAMAQDMKNGSGSADRQLLETFDGDGFASIRVGDKPRSYESCHVSIFGNIQPEVLRELINGEDNTGKFARFLFCRVPTKALLLSDEDPTDEEWDAHEFAQQKLRDYASKIYAEPPRVYKLSADARKAFNYWFNKHQETLLLPAMPGVVRSLLGKTSAHALRIAGNLHLLRVVSGECSATDRISPQTMDAAMAIVDQLTKETEAFHETPETDTTRLMRHIHQLSWVTDKPVDRVAVKAKANREMRRTCTAEAFKAAVQLLVDHRYGEMITDGKTMNGKVRALRYAAIREMSQ